MKLISCHDGKLHTLEAGAASGRVAKTFRTGLPALDALLSGGAFARGAVHELLAAPGEGQPLFFAALLARHASQRGNGIEESGSPAVSLTLSSASPSAVIWSDPRGELYPPALAALGIPLERVFLMHQDNAAEQVWAIAECLRCRGVGAVVATVPHRLSRIQARQIQLAAERGGGVGLLLRSAGKTSAEHAAVTRWRVQPEPGDQNVQRWRIQLVFGHGGHVGRSIILEHYRDPSTSSAASGQRVRPVKAHPVHPAAKLADRPAPARAATAS